MSNNMAVGDPTVRRRSQRVERMLGPLRDFVNTKVSSGILLLLAALLALLWANSPWGSSYTDLWHSTLTIDVAGHGISMDVQHWINDGLMAIFFFVVGLEIKREVLVGELSSVRQALLPVTAAFGGAVLPAILYLLFNFGTDATHGWGVPMATDIAFALGVLALLGSRAPVGLKIFLTALAIADDIMAVLVIAVFYTSDLKPQYLLAGLSILGLLAFGNWLGFSRMTVYSIGGIALWFMFLESGVHATVAGVLLALVIPARTRINSAEFLEGARRSLDEFDRAAPHGASVLTNHRRQIAVHDLQHAVDLVESPMQKFEHALHFWVAFLIIPLFGLANAGVSLGGNIDNALTSPIAIGIFVGLVVGKQLGITASAYLVCRAGVTRLPTGVSWRHIYGAGWLAGIGFTMSLFIADLGFTNSQDHDIAKIGILGASLVSGTVGWTLIRIMAAEPLKDRTREPSRVAETASSD